jgi:hypothetical protein
MKGIWSVVTVAFLLVPSYISTVRVFPIDTISSILPAPFAFAPR